MIGEENEPTEYRLPPTAPPGAVTLPLALGTPTTGLWCGTCLLPSRYEVPLYALIGEGGPINVGVFDRCDGCQSS